MKKLLLLSFGLCLIGYVANAQTLNENFESYTAGNLAGKGNWIDNPKYSGVSIKVTSSGLNGDKAVQINPGGSAGDGPIIPFSDGASFTKTATTGVIYVSFLVKFNALPTNANGSYFFYLADVANASGSDGRGRIYVKPDPSASGKFAIGAIASSNAVTDITFTPYQYELGKTYFIIEKYEKNSVATNADKVSLWISSSTVTSGETAPTVANASEAVISKQVISGVGFRTFETSYNIIIDDIKAANNWDGVKGTNVPLPVKLTSFTGQKQNNHIQLNWTTASEQSNSHFEVLRSGDGKNFNVLTTVSGKGTTTQISNYSYVDVNPLPGTSYYQLRQVDYDGESEKSDIVAVTNTLEDISTMSISASSDQDYIKLFILSAVNEAAEIHINGISGNNIASQKINLAKGENVVQVPVKAVNGIYVANLVSATQHISAKFVK